MNLLLLIPLDCCLYIGSMAESEEVYTGNNYNCCYFAGTVKVVSKFRCYVYFHIPFIHTFIPGPNRLLKSNYYKSTFHVDHHYFILAYMLCTESFVFLTTFSEEQRSSQLKAYLKCCPYLQSLPSVSFIGTFVHTI